MKEIKGFEGMYAVTKDGRVFGLPHQISNGKGIVQTKFRELKPNKLAKGYLQVTLYNRQKRTCKLVHRLVAETYLPNPKGFDQINHIDGIKTNNDLSNLEWCNNSMNQLHAWRTGLQKPHIAGKPMRKVILTKNNERLEFKSVADAARFLNQKVTANLQKVLHNKPRYKTIKGYKAEYGKA